MVKSETARLDAVFHALADETRRSIFRDVAAGEKSVSDVVRPYAMSQAAVSKHLNVLEEAKLIDPFGFSHSVSWVLSVWSAIGGFKIHLYAFFIAFQSSFSLGSFLPIHNEKRWKVRFIPETPCNPTVVVVANRPMH